MFCDNCGKQMPDNASFCSECGHRLREESYEDSQQKSVEQFESYGAQYSYIPRYDILEGKAIVSLVAGIVGLCTSPILVGIIAWIAGRRALKENPQNPLAKAGRVLGIIGFFMGLISAIILGSFGVAVWNMFTLN